MPQLQVPIVRTAALPYDCYPPLPETLFEDMVARIVGQFLNNLNGVIISGSAPGVNDRDKLWFNTNNGDNQIYSWVLSLGLWARKHPFAPSSAKRIWFPLESDLITEDGGSAGAVGDASGPFWVRDADFDGKFPLAKGDIPGTSPVVTVTDGTTGGEYSHTITPAEGAIQGHTHAFGLTNPGNDDAYFAKSGVNTVQSYSGYYITGSNGNIVTAQTTADLFTLPPLDAAGVPPTPTPLVLMPPYIVGCWGRRSARIWILPL